jgi:3-deoxy-alpha-D-manno-octulosonate 8-oxidase
MSNVLKTGISNVRNIARYIFAEGAIEELPNLLRERRKAGNGSVVFLVDEFFNNKLEGLLAAAIRDEDQVLFVSTRDEPTTEGIDDLTALIRQNDGANCSAIVGMGGGITLDTAKAVSNLLTNPGGAAKYQGWDLVEKSGVYKIGIPTLSGTGAEATRTCVMTNKATGLKLGMNSDHTVFDQLILDPNLTATVPRDQYFFSAMDAFIHCIEALNGRYRNPIGDSFSTQAISLCREIFNSNEMMSDVNRAKLMVASYLGGCAIATSYVGVVHPFSAGLSVVLGLHHCVSNCIVMTSMEPFYPREFHEFMRFVEKIDVELPRKICSDLDDEKFEALYDATVVHEKPLINALGRDFKKVLTPSRVRAIFEQM